MTDLSQASRDDLLALVAQQQEVIAAQQALITELQAAVAALQARVAELEAIIAGRGGPPKTPGNSSVPPSQGFKAHRAERRRQAKRGPKPGHPGLGTPGSAPGSPSGMPLAVEPGHSWWSGRPARRSPGRC